MVILILIFLQESQHLQSSNFKKIMVKFTPVCQRYTDMMAHKHYLQDILFNKTNDPTVIMQLTLVIIELQVMANSLQTVQVCCIYYYCKHTL